MQERCEGAEKKRTLSKFRAPVVCVLGHVDTGKLRGTNVQGGEANGITQQIGATNVPTQAIREASKMVASFQDLILKVPGLVIIDTPVSNLSSTCVPGVFRCPTLPFWWWISWTKLLERADYGGGY